jgi:alkyl hydroperoxide reductase subunit AhpC
MKAACMKLAPAFEGKVWSNTTRAFKSVKLADYAGKNLLLTFYPLNFTFVCPTEINELDIRRADFAKANTELLVCSVDSHHSHRAWSLTDRE